MITSLMLESSDFYLGKAKPNRAEEKPVIQRVDGKRL